jgi:dCTP deaminase
MEDGPMGAWREPCPCHRTINQRKTHGKISSPFKGRICACSTLNGEPEGRMTSVILHDTAIADLFEGTTLEAGQIQPASLDLRLGERAYRLRASFLPGRGRSVTERLGDQGLVLHQLDLTKGTVLETGCVYLVELLDHFNMPGDIEPIFNPKSSTGRLDVFTRVVCDGASVFDRAPHGYRGPLYLEVSPRTFPILVRTGDRLAQARFRKGDYLATRDLLMHIDLSGGQAGLLGYRAKRHAGIIDIAHVGGHSSVEFWDRLEVGAGALVLDPGEFYILASLENCEIGYEEAAEMAPTSLEIGEFRVHYAGFMDPGFGLAKPARAVLEVRGRDVPFLLEHGQPIARLEFEAMLARPDRPYGGPGSNYSGQGLKLSKHFY